MDLPVFLGRLHALAMKWDGVPTGFTEAEDEVEQEILNLVLGEGMCTLNVWKAEQRQQPQKSSPD